MLIGMANAVFKLGGREWWTSIMFICVVLTCITSVPLGFTYKIQTKIIRNFKTV